MKMKKKRLLSLRNKESISGYLFILPWIIGFFAFFFLNFVLSVQYSFNLVEMTPGSGKVLTFTGFKNYIDLFTDHATFARILTETMGTLVIDVPLITFFSLFIAIFLNRSFKGRGLVRAIFFLPVVMASGAISGAIAEVLRNMMGGISNVPDEMVQNEGLNVAYVVNQFMRYGVPPNIIEYLMMAVSRIYDIIKASGVQIIIFLSALQSISASLYEVAKIEGATVYESFWKITFPMVSPFILTNVVYTIVDSYVQSEVVQLAYDTAFTNFNFGMSSAMGLISALCTCLILLVVSAIISAYTFYQN
jgi:ABC-type sugar transport system permease subunit